MSISTKQVNPKMDRNDREVRPTAPDTSNLGDVVSDDALYGTAGPAIKAATPAEDVCLLSDDENKILTTLEPATKRSQEGPKPDRRSDSTLKISKATPETSLSADKPNTVTKDKIVAKSSTELVKDGVKPVIQLPSKEDLINKIRSRLSKTIEAKPLNPQPADEIVDTSGIIEIPPDLILSTEIPATPVPVTATKEAELEDHDLIAILEGNDVQIRRVVDIAESGETSAVDDDSMFEEMQIVIVNGDELQQAQLEREKEIARRQMANLPPPQKRGRPKQKPDLAKSGTVQSAVKKSNDLAGPPKSKDATQKQQQAEELLPVKSPQVTILGQTTIRPIPKKSNSPVMMVGKVKDEFAKVKGDEILFPKPKSNILPTVNRIVPKTAEHSDVMADRKLVKSSKPSPANSTSQATGTKKELIDSLVSDWDDDVTGSTLPIRAEKTQSIAKPLPERPEIVQQPSISEQPTAEPPKRLVKKKIIWDPSDATVPFSVLVKSNRSEVPITAASSIPKMHQEGRIRIRKRADSVAVHMIEDRSQRAPTIVPQRKRAITPEPSKPNDATMMEPPLPQATDAKASKKRKNEIEKLLGDEGAINMLYEVECETTHTDLLKGAAVDTSDEEEKLQAKAKIITDAVIKQGKSPSEMTSVAGVRVRPKRVPTPSPVIPQTIGTNKGSTNTLSDALPEIKIKKPTSPNSSFHSNNGSAKPLRGTAAGPGRKRRNTSATKSWDYVYNTPGGDDAMIIRRRSNSSYSSCDSPRRLSVECPPGQEVTIKSSPPSESKKKSLGDDEEVFAKPTNTATPKPVPIVDAKLLSNMKNIMSKALKGKIVKPEPQSEYQRKEAELITSSPPSDSKPIPKKPRIKQVGPMRTGALLNGFDETLNKCVEQLKQVTCSKSGSYVEVRLNSCGVLPQAGKSKEALQNVFSCTVMKELTELFPLFENDSSIKAVLLCSEGSDFSRGLDIGYLIRTEGPELNTATLELSECLRIFLKTLLCFTKPIIAAVHGDVLGLGVMLLPVFDVVVAQTGTSFMAPYGHFGYLPEGLKAFSSCRMLQPKAHTDLLLLGKRIFCQNALEYGLITEHVEPNRLLVRAQLLTKMVAAQSSQAMQSIKYHLRHDLITNLDAVLTQEQKQHVKQWETPECQQKFREFISKGGLL